ncbi:hypothetical protein FE783_34545 [Paenibacillus mesophilus]|uniref:serine hydrolase domain-containing protein n=1 Tax=Paenibacillus mesophilus TaxID=2582849 RepID=UPI00110DD0D0|nr:serine hydrolase [Paenibacillus mesophilus]TMV43761.1 hypothetical protein FE783_34545 [Paenibacillus mesophilus]
MTNMDPIPIVATPTWAQEADRCLRRNLFNGTVLIAIKGEILFCQGYGKASESETCSPQTAYRLMSISKQFTAAAILQLEERGLLCVNDTIEKYNSTVGDLLLWDRALYSERILKKDSIEKMYKPNPGSYGYGWSINPRNPSVVAHNGNGSGFSTFIYREMDTQTLLVVLSNVTRADAGKTGFDLLNVMAKS